MADKIIRELGTIGPDDMAKVEVFQPTMRLRWVMRKFKLPDFYQPGETESPVLQQLWRGSRGTERWEDVPVEHADN